MVCVPLDLDNEVEFITHPAIAPADATTPAVVKPNPVPVNPLLFNTTPFPNDIDDAAFDKFKPELFNVNPLPLNPLLFNVTPPNVMTELAFVKFNPELFKLYPVPETPPVNVPVAADMSPLNVPPAAANVPLKTAAPVDEI